MTQKRPAGNGANPEESAVGRSSVSLAESPRRRRWERIHAKRAVSRELDRLLGCYPYPDPRQVYELEVSE